MNSDALIKKTTNIMFGDGGVNGTAQYLSQLVWILFLKVFDYKEQEWELEDDYNVIIEKPFRFRDWADPRDSEGKKDLKCRMTGDRLTSFVNDKLFPYLCGDEVEYEGKKYFFDKDNKKANIIREFMRESTNYMKSGVKLRQVIDEIANVDFEKASEKHDFNVFYETLLNQLQAGGRDGGEFYTPRALTKFIVDHVDPKIGEKIADFACGTGGFLTEAINHLEMKAKTLADRKKIQTSLFGIEWKQLPYMLATTNMLLHNIDNPNIMHGDGLAKNVLDLNDEDLFDCIIMNPPFGGHVEKSNLQNFPNDISSSESADLFVARIIYCLKKNGRCGLILPDGLLFNCDNSKVNLKRKLLEECNLHTIIRMPQSVFAPYAGIATNILFFDKTKKTSEIWYYRVDMPEGVKHFNKSNPITRNDLKCVDEWWENRVEIKDEKDHELMTETWKSRKISIEDVIDNNYNLDYCGYPTEEKIILSPEETIENYINEKNDLELKLNNTVGAISDFLNDKETKLDNLISITTRLNEINSIFPNEIKASLVQAAMEGKLTKQMGSDSNLDELFENLNILTIDRIDETPFEIPETWRWVRLGDFVEVISGTSYNKSNIVKEGLRIFRGGNLVGTDLVKLADDVFLDHDEFYNKEKCVRKNDIVIVASTGSITGIGRPAFCDKDLEEECQIGAFLRIVRCKESNYYPYIKLIFDSFYYRNWISNKVSGIGIKNVKADHINDLLIPFPPIEEQERIVKKLNKLLPIFNN